MGHFFIIFVFRPFKIISLISSEANEMGRSTEKLSEGNYLAIQMQNFAF